MKKLVVFSVVACMLIMTGSVFAAVPNTDYSTTGKGAVGVSFSRSDVEAKAPGRTFDFDKQWNFGANAELVIAPKWAVGLNYMCSKSDETRFGPGTKAEASLTTYELTAQYMAYQKDGFSLIPYVGWARDKAKVKMLGNWSQSKSNNDFLLGTKLVYDFNERFLSYADIGFGSDVFKWGVGVAYKFTPQLALSLGYEYRKVDDFKLNNFGGNGKVDAKAKNISIGLTYLF